jgi:arylsulfatase A-like enzyme
MQEGDFSRQAYRIVCPVKSLEWPLDRFRRWRRKHRPGAIRKWQKIEGEGAYHGFHVHDYLTRVPWFLTGGGFPAGLRIPDQVRHVDLMPTVLEALGIEDDVTDRLDGRSLMPLVRGESMEELPAYMEATGIDLGSEKRWRSGIRTSEWKYSRLTRAEDPEEELYDLRADPEEQTNLAAERPEVAARLSAEMAKIMEAKPGDLEEMSEQEKDELEAHLRDLGYMD